MVGSMPTRRVLNLNLIRFEVRLWAGGPDRELLPFVDDLSLADLVAQYEQAAAHDTAGGYAGLVLENLDYSDLTGYLTGMSNPVAVLGHNCGEVDCWSLQAEIQAGDDLVVWQGFSQPHRPARDYGSFGPFQFRRGQYDHAVREVLGVI